MKFELCEGVTLETSDKILIEVLSVINNVKNVIKAYQELPYEDVIKTTNYDWHKLSNLMDAVVYDDAYKPYRSLVEHYYWLEDAVSNEAYQKYAMADFKAFEAKHVDFKRGVFIGTEEDYDFYSDWSKDIFGRRIRWTRVDA